MEFLCFSDYDTVRHLRKGGLDTCPASSMTIVFVQLKYHNPFPTCVPTVVLKVDLAVDSSRPSIQKILKIQMVEAYRYYTNSGW